MSGLTEGGTVGGALRRGTVRRGSSTYKKRERDYKKVLSLRAEDQQRRGLEAADSG